MTHKTGTRGQGLNGASALGSRADRRGFTVCLDGSRDGWLTQDCVDKRDNETVRWTKLGDNIVYQTGSTSERFDGEFVRA